MAFVCLQVVLEIVMVAVMIVHQKNHLAENGILLRRVLKTRRSMLDIACQGVGFREDAGAV